MVINATLPFAHIQMQLADSTPADPTKQLYEGTSD